MTPPGVVAEPSGLDCLPVAPLPAQVPGTAVGAARAARSTILDHRAPDDCDIWYRCRFDAPGGGEGQTRLAFDGLATIGDVWLNGSPVLHSENMFLRSEIEVGSNLLARGNELCLRFASLNEVLKSRRPRPRWRTHLVDDTNLRWIRTTLLGRMPGWHTHARNIHAVGPWRPVWLIHDRRIRLIGADVRPSLRADNVGAVIARIVVECFPGTKIRSAALQIGDTTSPLSNVGATGRDVIFAGSVELPEVRLWWPHTHGRQPLYPVTVTLTLEDETASPVEIDFGQTGFRSVGIERAEGDFAFAVNDTAVFLRGACWTTADPPNLTAPPGGYARPLALARDAGMNLFRLPGTGFPEADAFYDACAREGIALWQDFSFALMDYPTGDSDFLESVREEARQLLDRLQLNPALAVLCGNSECAATAALQGQDAAVWTDPLFEEILPALTRESRPDVPYLPSSEWGGGLPFHVDSGVAYYYGVGAYVRPLDDARRAGVRFASECLAFANIPEPDAIDAFLRDGEAAGNHPSWKAGVPRNVSGGWDFDDVRDHYVRTLFGEDPGALRFSDPERYLAVGRAASGEAMAATFAEWRRAQSPCRGGLVHFFQDLWPGAGWGILDSEGRPKSVFYYLKRALAPVSVFFSDEGLSGLRVHVVNERALPLDANLSITFFERGQTRMGEHVLAVAVPARGAADWSADAIVGRFGDTAYAYRFGPAVQDVTVAALRSPEGDLLAPTAFFFPTGRRFAPTGDVGLETGAARRSDGGFDIRVRAARFAQTVCLHAGGFRADDNYFHLEPGGERILRLIPEEYAKRRSAAVTVGALNSTTQVTVGLDKNDLIREQSAP